MWIAVHKGKLFEAADAVMTAVLHFFMRASRRRVSGDSKTSALCHRHALHALAPLSLSDVEALFSGHERAVNEAFRKIEFAALAQDFGQRLDHPPEHTRQDLLLEAALAGPVRWEARRLVLPARARAQYLEGVTHDRAGVASRPAAPVAAAPSSVGR